MHLELQAVTPFGPLQRLGRRNIYNGNSGSFKEMDVDLLPTGNRVGLVELLFPSLLVILISLKVRNNLGPAPDDILLGDFGNKIDED